MEEEHAGKRHKPKASHPWKRSIGRTEIHKWAYEQSKISELAIKQPVKFTPKN